MADTFIAILQEIRGTAPVGSQLTDGIYHDITIKDYNGNSGIYGDIIAKYEDIDTILTSALVGTTVTASVAVTKGQPVSFQSYDNGTDIVTVALADKGIAKAVGLASTGIAAGQVGNIITTGVLSDVDTSAYVAGSLLYLNTAGALTSTKPTTGIIQPVALVLRSHISGALVVDTMTIEQDSASTLFDSSNSTLTDTTVQGAIDSLDTKFEDRVVVVDAAINAVLPDQAANAGNFLTTDGTTVSWSAVDAFPDQTGNTSKVLVTDGTNVYWGEAGSNGATDVTEFNGVLSAADTTIQSALETIDDIVLLPEAPNDGLPYARNSEAWEEIIIPDTSVYVTSDTTLVTNSTNVTNMVAITQADYYALGAYDVNTFYLIVV